MTREKQTYVPILMKRRKSFCFYIKPMFLKISVNSKRSIGKSLVQALHSGSETFKTVE
ncbi:hypothetical protein DXY21_00513 [Bacillus velezensis]|nr:hypothetical protein DXY21_00513 [Bacillus velezensis]